MSNKSYIKYYWISWVSLFSLLFLAKLLHIPVLRNAPIHVVYFIYWFLVMCAGALEGNRLMGYLEDHHTKKWEEIGATLFTRSFKSLRFIYSSDDLGDAHVAFLKSNSRRFTKFAIVVFVCFPIFSILGFMMP